MEREGKGRKPTCDLKEGIGGETEGKGGGNERGREKENEPTRPTIWREERDMRLKE